MEAHTTMVPVNGIQQHTGAVQERRRGRPARLPVPAQPLVIVVGGDAPTRAMFHFLLTRDRCAVQEAATPDHLGEPGPALLAALLVVIAEPGATPLATTVHTLRQRGYDAPLLVLAHQPSLLLRQRAFQLGARDVVSLPMEAQGLLARLRAILGMPASPARPAVSTTPVHAGGLVLHPLSRTLYRGSTASVALTRREATLLERLMQVPGQVVGRHDLLDQVWGESEAGTDRALEVYIHRLRRKLAQPAAPHGYIRTLTGHGYSFDARQIPRPVT